MPTTTTFLDTPPETFKANDEMSNSSEAGPTYDVHDDQDRLIGQVCRIHINGHGTKWSARDRFHAEYGDAPGQHTGWRGRFTSRAEAEAELRAAVATRSAQAGR